MDILRRKLGERFLAGIVLYSGRQAQAVGIGCTFFPFVLCGLVLKVSVRGLVC